MIDDPFLKRKPIGTSVHPFGTPGMGVSLWGVSPLCDFGSLKGDQYTK